jgi:hypothetical protein
MLKALALHSVRLSGLEDPKGKGVCPAGTGGHPGGERIGLFLRLLRLVGASFQCAEVGVAEEL